MANPEIKSLEQSFTVSNSDNDSSKQQLMETESNCVSMISFDPQGGMKLEKWLEYFEEKCSQQKFSDEWKVQNLSRFLKGDALTVFVNSCLHIKDWTELKDTLHEMFFATDSVDFAEFSNLKYKIGDDLKTYFHKKVEIGQKLGLSKKIIVEGLTEGLDSHLRLTITANPPQTITEWLVLATKLIKIKSEESKQNQTTRSNFFTPRFNPSSNQFRPWRQNYDQQNQFRQWRPRSEVFGNRRFPVRVNNQTNHHQVSNLPPRPCRKCQNFGIANAYHWEQVCSLTERLNNVQVSRQNRVISNNSQDGQNGQ